MYKYVLVVACIFIQTINDDFGTVKELMKEKKYEKSLSALNSYINLHGKSLEALKLRYRCFYNLGEYGYAKTDLDDLQHLGIKSDSFYTTYADVLYKVNMFDSALVYLNKANRIDSTYRTLNYNYSIVYFKHLHNNNLALIYIDKELKYHTMDIEPHLLKTDILTASKRYSDAFKETDKIYKIDSTESGIFLERGILYFAIKNYKKSLENYNKALFLDENNADYLLGRAWDYFMLKKYNLAIQDLNICIKSEKRNKIDEYKLRLSCYKNIGMIDSACHDLKVINQEYDENYKANIYCKIRN